MQKFGFGAIALVALGVVLAAPVHAGGAPGGSYTQTCMNLNWDGQNMTASCQRRDGSMAESTLPFANKCQNGVANQNGQLRCAGYVPNGSYLSTCTNARSEEDGLAARCRTADGEWNDSFMDDPWPCNNSISNQDGVLTCDEQGD